MAQDTDGDGELDYAAVDSDFDGEVDEEGTVDVGEGPFSL